MFLALNLILTKKQKFGERNFIECNSIEQTYKWEKQNCKNINSVNPLHLIIDEMIGHFEEKNENKYLVLDDVDENK